LRKYDSKVNSKKLTNIIVPMNKNKNKKTLLFSLLLALSLIGSISIIINSGHSFVPRVYAARAKISPEGPIINDPNLVAQVVFKGLKAPTSMAFLGPNDILVLEKNEGTVQRIVNGKMLAEPLLHVNVSSADERGLLGIAVTATTATTSTSTATENNMTGGTGHSPTYVFLYFTEAGSTKGDVPAGNRIYRYELVNNKLINPKLLLNLPAIPGPSHNGGKLMIGPDNNLYFPIGDLKSSADFPSKDFQTKAQNYVDGINTDGRAGILRITQDGGVVGGVGVLGNEDPLNKYYAYGIKNSFGIGFDPVTGKLWDTENGPTFGDEINLVEPGFNGGWAKIQGIWTVDEAGDKGGEIASSSLPTPSNGGGLVDFGGKGKYSAPELTWADSFGPTALKFLNSDKLGKQYQNDMFVGDINYGNLYHFKLDQNRTGLLLDGPLADKVASKGEDEQTVFAHGFGGITDIEVGPDDGYLYILTFDKVDGTIFRIVPKVNDNNAT
jgi:aldose sugar dehydrogenase